MTKEISFNITEQEMEELREGKPFHWTQDGVLVHLFRGEEGE